METNPIPSRTLDQHIQVVEQDHLHGATTTFLRRFITLDKLQNLGVPEERLDQMYEELDRLGKEIAFLSVKLGNEDPEKILPNKVADLARQFDKYGHTIPTVEGFNISDLNILQTGFLDIANEGPLLSSFTDEEQKAFEDQIHNMAVERSKRFVMPKNPVEEARISASMFTLPAGFDREYRQLGVWHEMPHSEETEDVVAAGVVLKPGRTIRIDVSSWDSDVFPPTYEDRSPYADEEETITYPETNSIFHYESEQKDKSIRTIGCPKDIDPSIQKEGSFKDTLTLLKDEGIQITPHLSYKQGSELKQILTDEIGISDEELEKISLDTLLETIMIFISDRADWTISGGEQENNIENILNEYGVKGKVSGACQTTSTLMAGFCEMLGLPSRRVSGSLTVLEDGSRGGHIWTEIYIPQMKAWVPADPAALGTLITYPSEGLQYELNGYIYPKGQEKIKVEYQDQ